MHTLQLLVVDDDPILVDALRELLLRRFPEAQIDRCISGPLSLEKIAAVDYDVIVSDVRMPGIDGIALLRRAHELRPETPIVLLTGMGDYNVAIEALRAGAFDFITKPVDTDYLAASISRALRVREIAQRLEEQRVELALRADELANVVDARTRELRAANRVKDEFLATLSHELRTPLTAMLGWSKLLLRNELEPAVHRQAIEAIERNATHQAHLVDDLLDVSRIMAGKLRLACTKVNFGEIVNAVIDGLVPAMVVRDMIVEREVDAGVIVYGDADRLHQIVTNLLTNAAKFTPDGGHVSVRLRRDGPRAVLVVSDTGVGISAAFLPEVFRRFHQDAGSLVRSRNGLGVGLAVVKHLVDLHGGEVHAASEGQNRGATFTVSLPAADASADSLERDNGPASDLRGVSVLLVEDDADARALLRYTLERSGANVTEADCAARAIEALDVAAFDVMLCDVSMPREDGYSLIRRVRKRPPGAGGDVLAAAVTAHARPEDVQRALAEGFDRHLSKPIEPHDLVATVVELKEHARVGTNSTV